MSPSFLRTPPSVLDHPLPPDNSTLPHNDTEETHDSAVIQLNAILQHAAMMALEVTATPRPPNYYERTRCLLRTLATVLDPGEPPSEAHDSRRTHAQALPSTPTYAAAASKVPATQSSNRHQRPPPPPAKRRSPPSRRQVNAPSRPTQSLSPYRASRIIVRVSGPPLEKQKDNLIDFFRHLQAALSSYSLSIRGVEFTRSGNLAIAAAAPTTAEQLLTQEDLITHCLRKHTSFSGGSIALELDGPWSSVVLHKVPLRHLAAVDREGVLDFSGWEERLTKGCEESGGVPGFSAACQRLRPLTKGISLEGLWDSGTEDVSIRVDLSDSELPEQLVLRGAVLGGLYCRVSRYRSRRNIAPSGGSAG